MKARMNVGGNRMRERVIKFQRRAEKDGERRVAQRLHGIRLNLDGRASGEIASILNVHRSNASLWLILDTCSLFYILYAALFMRVYITWDSR